jgi:hypothetical protein
MKLRITGQILVVLALAATATAWLWEDSVSRPIRLAFWSTVMLMWASTLTIGVIQKRRAGQNWNEALSSGSKLMTGSVWKDGAIFAAILVATGITVFALIIWL